MSFIVDYAVYGALAGGNAQSAQCVSVTSALSRVLNNPGGGTAVCGNNLLGLDPSPGNTKHFGALVNNRYFACQEGQSINFNDGGGLPIVDRINSTTGVAVKFAVYGALPGGDKTHAEATDVTALLQAELNITGGTAVCGDGLFGDPSPNNKKHFAAVVTRGDEDYYYACAEGQTINFNSGV